MARSIHATCPSFLEITQLFNNSSQLIPHTSLVMKTTCPSFLASSFFIIVYYHFKLYFLLLLLLQIDSTLSPPSFSFRNFFLHLTTNIAICLFICKKSPSTGSHNNFVYVATSHAVLLLILHAPMNYFSNI